jgi:hypothetical protein
MEACGASEERMHEKERHRIILSAVQEKPVATVPELVDLTGSSEATIRRDIAALHVQKRLRRVRGRCRSDQPSAVRRSCRPSLPGERRSACAGEAGDRPGSGGALSGRRADHHQWRHHDLSDGAFPGQSPDAGLHQFLPDRRTPAQAFEEHRDAVGRDDLSRAEHHIEPLRERRDAQLLCAAHVHGGRRGWGLSG